MIFSKLKDWYAKKATPLELNLEGLRKILSNPKRTNETVTQYQNMTKDEKDKAKNRGALVAGVFEGNERKRKYIKDLCGLILDADYANDKFVSNIDEKIKNKFLFHSTHSHTDANQRYRVFIPTDRLMTPDECVAVSRKVAEEIGIDYFDKASFDPSHLMCLPTCSIDSKYVFIESKYEELLKVDEYLSKYKNWKDISEHALTKEERERHNFINSSIYISPDGKAVKPKRFDLQDPKTLSGIRGKFNEAYTITEAIDTFLSDIYKKSNVSNRYDFIESDATCGLVIFDNGYAYSHYASDPAGGYYQTAYDLVRIHKFADKDKDVDRRVKFSNYPSVILMNEFALKDSKVKALCKIEPKTDEYLNYVCDDWEDKITYVKNTTLIENNQENACYIISNDKNLKNIRLNVLTNQIIADKLPWIRSTAEWSNDDDSQLSIYINHYYGQISDKFIRNAFIKVAVDNNFHPIKQYLENLKPWDKVKRNERLFIKYFGASDTEYIRECAKLLCLAAVGRIYEPGIKYDYVIILCGLQGSGKSTFFRKLAKDWFSDSLKFTDLVDKTGDEKLQGTWINEVGELAGKNQIDVETIKAYITKQVDKYRPAYGKTSIDHPRRCIIVGTTNRTDGFLKDITGNRRFLIIETSNDRETAPWNITNDEVDQIWAEAVYTYKEIKKSGKPFELKLSEEMEKEAEKIQEKFMEPDDREGIVKRYVDMPVPLGWKTWNLNRRRSYISNPDSYAGTNTYIRKEICTMDIWCECYGNQPGTMEKPEGYKIGLILKRLRFESSNGKQKAFGEYGKQRYYIRKDDPITNTDDFEPCDNATMQIFDKKGGNT